MTNSPGSKASDQTVDVTTVNVDSSIDLSEPKNKSNSARKTSLSMGKTAELIGTSSS